MLEILNALDTDLLISINSMHTDYLDRFMYMVSGKWIWVPMYLVVLLYLLKSNWRQGLTILFITVIAIVMADQISSGIIKHAVERFRPTHEPAIAQLIHVVNDYRGGRFGFVSSHAANTVAFALLFSLIIKCRWFTIPVFLWAALVMYSRMYLGVHYPGDIFGGIVVGAVSGYACYMLYKYILYVASQGKLAFLKCDSWNYKAVTSRSACEIGVIIICCCLIITAVAYFVF